MKPEGIELFMCCGSLCWIGYPYPSPDLRNLSPRSSEVTPVRKAARMSAEFLASIANSPPGRPRWSTGQRPTHWTMTIRISPISDTLAWRYFRRRWHWQSGHAQAGKPFCTAPSLALRPHAGSANGWAGLTTRRVSIKPRLQEPLVRRQHVAVCSASMPKKQDTHSGLPAPRRPV